PPPRNTRSSTLRSAIVCLFALNCLTNSITPQATTTLFAGFSKLRARSLPFAWIWLAWSSGSFNLFSSPIWTTLNCALRKRRDADTTSGDVELDGGESGGVAPVAGDTLGGVTGSDTTEIGGVGGVTGGDTVNGPPCEIRIKTLFANPVGLVEYDVVIFV